MKINKIDIDLPDVDYQTEGSVGVDLYSRMDLVIPKGEMRFVPLNVTVETDSDCMTMLAPRSSLYKNKGLILANSIGVIDQDYNGPKDEVMACFVNISNHEAKIETGERVAQIIPVKIKKEEITSYSYDGENRGGFGSTG